MKTFSSFLQKEVFKESVLITSHFSLKLFKNNLDRRSVNANSLNAVLPDVTIVSSLNKHLKTGKIWIKLFKFIKIKKREQRAKILTQAEIKHLKENLNKIQHSVEEHENCHPKYFINVVAEDW